jgi:hypothetical protein
MIESRTQTRRSLRESGLTGIERPENIEALRVASSLPAMISCDLPRRRVCRLRLFQIARSNADLLARADCDVASPDRKIAIVTLARSKATQSDRPSSCRPLGRPDHATSSPGAISRTSAQNSRRWMCASFARLSAPRPATTSSADGGDGFQNSGRVWGLGGRCR